MLITQGSSARLTPETKNLPVDTVIIGIVDRCTWSPTACIREDTARPGTRAVTFRPSARGVTAILDRITAAGTADRTRIHHASRRSLDPQRCRASAGRSGQDAARPAAAASYVGRLGLFTDANEAVAAAREAFEQLSRARLEDRKRIIDHIRRIAIDQCVELGTMEMEETKIGRLEHKIEKLKTLGERTPGRRVPAERGVQRRPRPGRDRARPVRRDRRDHAGHPLAAHASPATR